LILTSALLGVIFAPLLVQLTLAVSSGAGVGRQIANAQIIFNVIGVMVVIMFLPVIARGLEIIVPDPAPQLPPEAIPAL
jgi:phosphate:Na+ symporter